MLFLMILVGSMDLGFLQRSVFSAPAASVLYRDLAADAITPMDISFPFDPGSVGIEGLGWK